MVFDWIDRMNEAIGRILAWFMVVMALLMVSVVLLRYVFGIGTLILQESILYLHGTSFMLTIAWALKRGGHVRVDVFYGRMTLRQRNLVDLTGHLLLLLPVCVLVFWTSIPYVQASWRILEGSADVGGIPGVFILKTLIPIFAILLFLQGLCEIARAVKGIPPNV